MAVIVVAESYERSQAKEFMIAILLEDEQDYLNLKKLNGYYAEFVVYLIRFLGRIYCNDRFESKITDF